MVKVSERVWVRLKAGALVCVVGPLVRPCQGKKSQDYGFQRDMSTGPLGRNLWFCIPHCCFGLEDGLHN